MELTKIESKAKKPMLPKASEEARKRLEQAKKYYGEMQRSWFYFAKTIKDIRDKKDYEAFYGSFREFCDKEFETVNYATISKFITIVETWGKSIEARIEKDKNFELPAYETCYTLATAQGKLDTEDFARLKKQILEHKMSYYTLRAELKAKFDAIKKKAHREIEESSDAIQSELLKDIDEEEANGEFHAEEADFMDSHDDVDMDDEDLSEVATGDVVSSTESRVDYLLDNLGDLEELIRSKGKVTNKHRDLATKIEKLIPMIDKFLNTIEELDT